MGCEVENSMIYRWLYSFDGFQGFDRCYTRREASTEDSEKSEDLFQHLWHSSLSFEIEFLFVINLSQRNFKYFFFSYQFLEILLIIIFHENFPSQNNSPKTPNFALETFFHVTNNFHVRLLPTAVNNWMS